MGIESRAPAVQFETGYTAWANRLFLVALAMHIPALAAVASGFKSNIVTALGLSALIVAGPAALCYAAPASRITSVSMGIASMALSGLLIHLGQGMIEMHFHVFIMLAMLMLLADAWVLIAAAAAIVIHHAVVYLYLPTSVFNYQAGFSAVLVHGSFVLLQVVPGCFVAQRIRRFVSQGSAVQRLGPVSSRLADGVEELAHLSQSLAKSATAQAATVERSGVSIEEIASMTRQNADNAQSAKGLATEARIAADAGSTDMMAMSKAMDALRAASRGISAIIKTIDEIAFQTNLLSLNAAVEAARAGEAGRGFAVVADEVRSLARRCAAAARETTEKIEDSIHKSEQGVEISGKVAGRLQEIVSKVRKVDELVAEIAASSKEQSRGIYDLNKSINEMDHATESNVENAERTMTTAQGLSSQSAQLKETIGALLTLISGTGGVGADDDMIEEEPEAEAPAPARNKKLKPAPDEEESETIDHQFEAMPQTPRTTPTPPARSAIVAVNPSLSSSRVKPISRHADIDLLTSDDIPSDTESDKVPKSARFPMKEK